LAKPRNKDEERSVDIDHLEPHQKKRAHDLGFRARISVNKVNRIIAHEQWTWRLCMGFTIFMAVATVACFALRVVLPEERKGHFLMMGLFAAFWALGSWAYSKRAARLEVWGVELLGIVKDKLGK
jgi:hypothetical protein